MRKNNGLILITLFLSLSILFFSCKPDELPYEPDGRSEVHILAVSQQQPEYWLVFDYLNFDNPVITNMFYERNWPEEGYAELRAAGIADEYGYGELEVSCLWDDTTNFNDTIFGPELIVLEKDTMITYCITDSATKIQSLKIYDNFTAPDSADSTFRFRFINLKYDFAGASLYSGTGSFLTSTTNTEFLEYSEFQSQPEGEYLFWVRNADSSLYMIPDTFNLERKKVYSFYISGHGQGKMNYFIH